MNIVATQFDLSHCTFEFYFSGCNFRCKNCQNEDIWNFEKGIPWKDFLEKNQTIKKINEASSLVQRIALLGGEPLHQNKEDLIEFLDVINKEFQTIEKILFTGFELEFIPKDIIPYFDYIKCGQYKEELTGENRQHGYDLATTNQYFVNVAELASSSKLSSK